MVAAGVGCGFSVVEVAAGVGLGFSVVDVAAGVATGAVADVAAGVGLGFVVDDVAAGVAAGAALEVAAGVGIGVDDSAVDVEEGVAAGVSSTAVGHRTDGNAQPHVSPFTRTHCASSSATQLPPAYDARYAWQSATATSPARGHATPAGSSPAPEQTAPRLAGTA